ncbi:hypothetical protein [Methyloceanibacter sp.]|uniref:hypothetical protein n=1 Tax=Methyloceanibacter sp. TaxID=1965321 RepID=UPI003D6C8313
MKRKLGMWPVVVDVIGGSAKLLCLGSVLLTAACSTPTMPSDFPAFHLTNSPDKDAAEQDR